MMIMETEKRIKTVASIGLKCLSYIMIPSEQKRAGKYRSKSSAYRCYPDLFRFCSKRNSDCGRTDLFGGSRWTSLPAAQRLWITTGCLAAEVGRMNDAGEEGQAFAARKGGGGVR